MEVGFYDPYIPSGYEKTLDIKRFDTIKELIKASSIISINAVLNSRNPRYGR